MKPKLAIALSTVVIVLLAGGFLVVLQQGGTAQPQSTTATASGGIGSSGLRLQLSVNGTSTGGSSPAVTFQIRVSEYNTLTAANNVSVARQWKLDGLSLGACGTEAFPFGVALYRGSYTAENASAAVPLRIYPVVACPMLLRLVTGYLFQPTSDLAVVLPSGPEATPTRMSANLTAAREYLTAGSLTPLGPGTYTVAAGDEWGSIVLAHFTVGTGATTSSAAVGTLDASFAIGPTQPVCMANSTVGPAPPQYSSIEAVVTLESSGKALTLPVSWLSSGCSVSGTLQANLAPGAYSLNLSSCQWMGCSNSLPRSFGVAADQTTIINVSIDTGIR
jgi:hypothetical protein